MNLNFQVTSNKSISKLLQDAEVFGLGWLGDGATIKQMPLLNILVLCVSAPPTVVSIVDCTKHISDGGQKNATYMIEKFQRKVNEINTDKLLSDFFLLQWCIKCPNCWRSSCVHGTPVQCISMEGSMSCPCFLATSPNSNPYRLVLYFLLKIFNFFF